MPKDTIIYIGGFELPDKNAAAHRVLSNGKIFRDLGYNVVFIDLDKNLPYGNDILNTKKEIQGFDCWSVPYPKTQSQWLDYLSNIHSFQKIYLRYTKVVAVICYNYQAYALYRIKKICNKDKIKIIADCTEWYSAKGNGPAFFIIKGLDTFFRMRILHKKMDGLIVISRYLEDYYHRCKNVINLPPLVDLKEHKWKHVIDLKKDNDITLVYAGSPGNKDKLDLLISALVSINLPYKLNVIGITDKQYLKYFPNQKEIIEKNKNKIFFRGRQDHLTVLNYIKQADYSCFLREINRVTKAGFPTKFVESISCGTPVITNSTSNIMDYITDNSQVFLVNNISKNELIQSFISVFTNHPLIKKTQWDQFDYRKYVQTVSRILI